MKLNFWVCWLLGILFGSKFAGPPRTTAETNDCKIMPADLSGRFRR